MPLWGAPRCHREAGWADLVSGEEWKWWPSRMLGRSLVMFWGPPESLLFRCWTPQSPCLLQLCFWRPRRVCSSMPMGWLCLPENHPEEICCRHPDNNWFYGEVDCNSSIHCWHGCIGVWFCKAICAMDAQWGNCHSNTFVPNSLFRGGDA